MDGGAVNAVFGPGGDLFSMRFHQRYHPWFRAGCFDCCGKLGSVREGKGRIEPSMLRCKQAKHGCFFSANELGAGKVAVGVAQPHAGKDLLVLVHLEPPIGHGAHPPEKFGKDTPGCRKVRESKEVGGAINPITCWRQ
jgi:hypothetical protein